LEAVLDKVCSRDERFAVAPPSTAPVREALQTCEQTIHSIAPAAFETTPSAEMAGVEAAGAAEAGGQFAATGAIGSRAQALAALEQVARFFEKTEPQSFIPYSLRQIIRRGSLALPELLAELIANEEARRDLSRLTGVPDQQERRE
jgi:predicted component of type VI protein secretion system